MTLTQRFDDACSLWALESQGLSLRDPQLAMQFVVDNWSELREALEIADAVIGKIATKPIVAAMVDALRTSGEIRALGGEDEEAMAAQFAVLMLKQAGYTFPPEEDE